MRGCQIVVIIESNERRTCLNVSWQTDKKSLMESFFFANELQVALVIRGFTFLKSPTNTKIADNKGALLGQKCLIFWDKMYKNLWITGRIPTDTKFWA